MSQVKAGGSSTDGGNNINGDVVLEYKNKNVLLVEEEMNSELVVGSSPNSSNFFDNPAHTSTPITTKEFFPTNFINGNLLQKALAFKVLKKGNNNNKIEDFKGEKEKENNLIKEFSDVNGKVELIHNGNNLKQFPLIFNQSFGLQKFQVTDRRLYAILITIGLFVIGNMMISVAVPYTNPDTISDLSKYAQIKFDEAITWITSSENKLRLHPFVWGLIVSTISFYLVYMDSKLPGVYPPSPFSPKSKEMYYRQQSTNLHLNYIIAITSGIFVSAILYYGN